MLCKEVQSILQPMICDLLSYEYHLISSDTLFDHFCFTLDIISESDVIESYDKTRLIRDISNLMLVTDSSRFKNELIDFNNSYCAYINDATIKALQHYFDVVTKNEKTK